MHLPDVANTLRNKHCNFDEQGSFEWGKGQACLRCQLQDDNIFQTGLRGDET